MKIISARILNKQQAVEPSDNTQVPVASQAPVETTIQAPDLEKGVLDTPLEEGQGLNRDVEELSEWALDTVQSWVGENAYTLIDSMTRNVAKRFSSPDAKNEFLGRIMFEVNLIPDKTIHGGLQIGRGEMTTFGSRYLINIDFLYNAEFRDLPEQKQAQELKHICFQPRLKNILVHELTHAHEDASRKKNGQERGVFNGDTLTLGDIFQDDPILKNIGRRIYLADDSEVNARVAEIGSLMQSNPSDDNNSWLYQKIKETFVWKQIKFLADFPTDEVYNALMERAFSEFSDELPQGDTQAAEALIAERIRMALYDLRFSGNKGGASRTSNRLIKILSYRLNNPSAPYRIKEVKDILKGLEMFFKQKADEMKRRVFKTIALAKEKMAVTTPMSAMMAGIDLDENQEPVKQGFDLAEFRDFKNFTDRMSYCNERLDKLANTTDRVIFRIDDTKVLKIAKNEKGIKRNEFEAQYMMQHDFAELVPKVFDTHDRELWIVAEACKKVTPTKFHQLTGVNMRDVATYLCNFIVPGYRVPQDERLVSFLTENGFVEALEDIVEDFSMNPSEFDKPTSWGIVVRDNKESIVLTHFSFITNTKVEESHATPSTANRYRHRAYNS